ncbi:hypothetical protein ACLOJK_023972 [Asimina triloba]
MIAAAHFDALNRTVMLAAMAHHCWRVGAKNCCKWLLPPVATGSIGTNLVGHCFCPNLGVMRKGRSGPEMDGGTTAAHWDGALMGADGPVDRTLDDLKMQLMAARRRTRGTDRLPDLYGSDVRPYI